MEKNSDALFNIKEIAISIAKAVSGIFPDVEVVVVGEDSLIFATSDKYIPAKGAPVFTPYIRAILHSEDVVIVEDPGKNSLCAGCANVATCAQKLEIAVPFRIEDRWSGYLSILRENSR